MPRAPFQVTVLPFRRLPSSDVQYAVFQRPDGSWQFVAGGGEDAETPSQAAAREAREEARIAPDAHWLALDCRGSIPRCFFPGGAHWPSTVYVIPEHCFAVDASAAELRVSSEHTRFEWLAYDDAQARLTWQSHRTALWELHQRLANSPPSPPRPSPPPPPVPPHSAKPAPPTGRPQR